MRASEAYKHESKAWLDKWLFLNATLPCFKSINLQEREIKIVIKGYIGKDGLGDFFQIKNAAKRIQASLFPLPIGAIVPLPSKTWKAQDGFAKALAKHLNVPLLSDLLVWKIAPEKRQGELLNNNQRHHNVHEKMQTHLPTRAPSGALILFDDYTGSGATLKEAARALRKTLDQPLVPFTIAAIKWRLGKPGFI